MWQAVVISNADLFQHWAVVMLKEESNTAGDLSGFRATGIHLQIDAAAFGLPLLCTIKLPSFAVEGRTFFALVRDAPDVGLFIKAKKLQVPMHRAVIEAGYDVDVAEALLEEHSPSRSSGRGCSADPELWW